MQILTVLLISTALAAALYLYAVAPRIFRKPDSTPFTAVLYAHRGLFDNSTDHPENSMNAFRRAVENGYGMEIDVQLTKDGKVVVFHDFTLDRVCGAAGKVCDYTYSALQSFSLFGGSQKIPLFSDFLSLVNGKVPLIVEYKLAESDAPDTLCTTVNAMLSSYTGAYCIESFNPKVVRWYKKHNPSVLRGQLCEHYLETGLRGNKAGLFLLQSLMTDFLTRPDFIAYNYQYRNDLSFRICCSIFGALPVAWTIKNQQQLDEARKYYRICIFDSFIPDAAE